MKTENLTLQELLAAELSLSQKILLAKERINEAKDRVRDLVAKQELCSDDNQGEIERNLDSLEDLEFFKEVARIASELVTNRIIEQELKKECPELQSFPEVKSLLWPGQAREIQA